MPVLFYEANLYVSGVTSNRFFSKLGQFYIRSNSTRLFQSHFCTVTVLVHFCKYSSFSYVDVIHYLPYNRETLSMSALLIVVRCHSRLLATRGPCP